MSRYFALPVLAVMLALVGPDDGRRAGPPRP
jgi:hypothetical protein